MSIGFGTIGSDANLLVPAAASHLTSVPRASTTPPAEASDKAAEGLEARRKKLKEQQKDKEKKKGAGSSTGSLRNKEREAEINRVRR